jgi:hypothetical protein
MEFNMVELISVQRVTDGTDIRVQLDWGERVTFHSPDQDLADPEGFALRAAVHMMLARMEQNNVRN